jgi:Uma2 family endonuclease
MTLAIDSPSKLMTIEDYLSYDDGTDDRYELVNGELFKVPTESFGTISIAKYIPFALILYNTEIAVSGKRSTCRIPDLMIITEDSATYLQASSRNFVSMIMPAPLLVVEVVSPGQENRDRDYRYKRTEYAARGINEYWIIDPEMRQITICLWVNGQYEDKIYTGDMPIASTVVERFALTVEQVLAYGQ